ncbi:hypothetical protein AB205_0147260, partial [Aquarana catesbeiana]
NLKLVDCQDALETAARAEGLPLDISMHSNLQILSEHHHSGKYHYGLHLLKPFRLTSKHQHPVDNAGLFSFMTFSWLTPLARVAYKKGELFLEDVWPLSQHESSDVNSRRTTTYERPWLLPSEKTPPSLDLKGMLPRRLLSFGVSSGRRHCEEPWLKTAREAGACMPGKETETLALEAPARIKNNAPPADWPQEGEIAFESAEMRYRENLPLVLKKVSFTIKPKEKIGIVGRTGSGKSSLGIALFRLVELSGGCIKIDGVKICDIGLADLRSKLAIIPQEPVLFSGTVRSNLDPFNQYSEEQIWDSLERTHMKECVSILFQSFVFALF